MQAHLDTTATAGVHAGGVASTITMAAFKQLEQPPTLIDPNMPQAFCLRWNNYQSNLTSVFEQLLQNEQFVDVTLSCDGVSIKAHKVVLSACSPYFTALFNENPCEHPIIIMRDIKLVELKAIVEFMYRGEINVCQDQIGPLLRIAELLKIRGLADVSADQRVEVETVATAAAAAAAAAAAMTTATTAPPTMATVHAQEILTEVHHQQQPQQQPQHQQQQQQQQQQQHQHTEHTMQSHATAATVGKHTVQNVTTSTTVSDWNENITTALSVPVSHAVQSVGTLLHTSTGAIIEELTAVDVQHILVHHQQQQPHHHHQQQPIIVDVVQPMPALALASAPAPAPATESSMPSPASTSVRSSATSAPATTSTTTTTTTAKPHRKRKLHSEKPTDTPPNNHQTPAIESSATTAASPAPSPATAAPTSNSSKASTTTRGRKAARTAAAAAAAAAATASPVATTTTATAAAASVATTSAAASVNARGQSPALSLAHGSPSQQDTFRELVIDEEFKANQLDGGGQSTKGDATEDDTTTVAYDDSDDNNSTTNSSSAFATDSPTAKSFSSFLKLKAPTWSQQQLREAIHSVITQKLRFTQASSRYNIPKGTLYDNILGKANRMLVLEESGLDTTAEKAVLEFCCDVSVSPYNRRTKKPLAIILAFVQNLSNGLAGGKCRVKFSGKFGFRWWWAFCKKYSIVSLHYDGSVAATAASAALAALASDTAGGQADDVLDATSSVDEELAAMERDEMDASAAEATNETDGH